MKITKVDTKDHFIEFQSIKVGQFFKWGGSPDNVVFFKNRIDSYIMLEAEGVGISYSYAGNSKVIPIEIVEIQYRLKG